MTKKPGGTDPHKPAKPGQYALGLIESRIMQTLSEGIGEALHFSLRTVGASQQSRKAWQALRAMPPAEWDSVMSFAAAGLLPQVLRAIGRDDGGSHGPNDHGSQPPTD